MEMGQNRQQNEEARKSLKQRKMNKVVKRSFAMGFLCCFVLSAGLLLAARLLGVGGLLLGGAYREYVGIRDGIGKYYTLTQLFEKKALNKYDDEGIDDSLMVKAVEKLHDPYARYFTAEEYKEYMRIYEPYFVGVGIMTAEEDGKVIIKGIMKEGSAGDAGLKEGDVIVKVDGKEIKSAGDATSAISGEAGTEVKITVMRNDELKSYTVPRVKIDESTVSSGMYKKDKKIGYVQITHFSKDTAKDFKLAVKDLKNQGCSKFIIDLRNNGGGLTSTAYKIADYLLPSCIICTEKDKAGKEITHKSRAGNAGIDYVVLVNGDTASASEIVSAAIQDNKGGKIIGTRTYGKGVTQAMSKFRDGSAVKFTVTEYFRPSGKKVNGVGITPDIIEEDNDEILKKAVKALQ